MRLRRTVRPLLLALSGAVLGCSRHEPGSVKPLLIPLWEQGAPGFESRRHEPEQAKDWWVKNIHYPTLTAYLPPKGRANGSAIVIAPGGGFAALVFGPEGIDPAERLSQEGVATFALKYRLPEEPGSPYSVDHARADLYRAIRLVRSRAAEWHIDPKRVGVLGFSAGAALVSEVAYAHGKGDPAAADPIDRAPGKPDFQLLIYPSGAVPDDVSAAPPTFLLVANDDQYGCDRVALELYTRLRATRLPVEAHFLERGSHGFNMGQRSKLKSVQTWPERMTDWLRDSGYLKR